MSNLPKTYYYDKSIQQLQSIRATKTRQRILLHGCCAPCSAFPLEFLANDLDITIYYNNSNIYPLAEYNIRLEELLRYVEAFNQTNGTHIDVIVPPYDYKHFRTHLEPLKDQPEGGARCMLCYRLRMKEAYAYANEHGYDWFCTVMTISRQKNSQVLNHIGQELEQLYPNTKYFYSDFKKKGGILRRNTLVNKHNLYAQQYCGCEFGLYNQMKKG